MIRSCSNFGFCRLTHVPADSRRIPEVLLRMGKAKKNRERKTGKVQAQPAPAAGRRKFLTLGLGGLGALAVTGVAGYKAGWFGSESAADGAATNLASSLATGKPLAPVRLSANASNALRAVDDLCSHYARELNDASSLIHAVRGFGKGFKLNDGTLAVDYLCSRFAAEKEVNGKRYVYFPREIEAHDNSILKALLEAGVSLDQPITVGSNKYTLGDLGESAKALFRCDPDNLGKYDPELLHSHLPWCLIAFAILVPASAPTWTNAWGETIDLPAVIDKSLAAFETTCAGVRDTIARGEAEPLPFRQAMSKFSCFGLHAVYAYYACLKHGYRGNNLPERLREMYDVVIHRLQGDTEAIDRESAMAAQFGQQYVSQMGKGPDGRSMTNGPPPPQVIEMMRLRYQIKLFGHAFEAINYIKLNQFYSPSPSQQIRLQAGEQKFYEYAVKLRASDLDPYLKWYDKFMIEFVIALGHASRALKLMTPENPDRVAS